MICFLFSKMYRSTIFDLSVLNYCHFLSLLRFIDLLKIKLLVTKSLGDKTNFTLLEGIFVVIEMFSVFKQFFFDEVKTGERNVLSLAILSLFIGVYYIKG